MKVILLGPPGAGKGTLAAHLAAHLSVPHLASGDILRAEIREGSELGLTVQKYMDSGDLVPDDVIVDVMIGRLTQADCADGFILDGFPRTLPQAQALTSKLAESGLPADHVVYLHADPEVVVARLAGRRICPRCDANYHVDTMPPAEAGKCDRDGEVLVSRPDDVPDVIRTRLKKYDELTQPLLDYYKAAGKFSRLDGNNSIEQVYQEAELVFSDSVSSADEH